MIVDSYFNAVGDTGRIARSRTGDGLREPSDVVGLDDSPDRERGMSPPAIT